MANQIVRKQGRMSGHVIIEGRQILSRVVHCGTILRWNLVLANVFFLWCRLYLFSPNWTQRVLSIWSMFHVSWNTLSSNRTHLGIVSSYITWLWLITLLMRTLEWLYSVSQKICYNLAHTKPLSWINLVDVQGVRTFIYWLSVFDSLGMSFPSWKKSIIHVLDIYCLKSWKLKRSRLVLFYYHLKMLWLPSSIMIWIQSKVISRIWLVRTCWGQHFNYYSSLFGLCNL